MIIAESGTAEYLFRQQPQPSPSAEVRRLCRIAGLEEFTEEIAARIPPGQMQQWLLNNIGRRA